MAAFVDTKFHCRFLPYLLDTLFKWDNIFSRLSVGWISGI